MVKIAPFLLAAACALGQTAGRIDGRVVSNGDPLGKAQVTLTRSSSPSSSPAPGSAFPVSRSLTVETSGDGTFSFVNLAPGEYVLTAESRGYASITRFHTLLLE